MALVIGYHQNKIHNRPRDYLANKTIRACILTPAAPAATAIAMAWSNVLLKTMLPTGRAIAAASGRVTCGVRPGRVRAGHPPRSAPMSNCRPLAPVRCRSPGHSSAEAAPRTRPRAGAEWQGLPSGWWGTGHATGYTALRPRSIEVKTTELSNKSWTTSKAKGVAD